MTLVIQQSPSIRSIIRIVADESARASFEMLNSVVQRASRLKLRNPLRTVPRTCARSTSGPETDIDIGSDPVMTYGTRRDDSSPGMSSEVEYRHDFQSSVSLPSPPAFANTGQLDPHSIPESPAGSSPGNWPPSGKRLLRRSGKPEDQD